MAEDLSSLIVARIPGLSKSHKRLAHYVLDHPDDAAFMNARALGKAVGISESTVVRFAAVLGYSGFPAFQKALQETVRVHLDSIRRIELSRALLSDGGDTVTDVPEAVLSCDSANIRQTLEELPRDVFHRAVESLIFSRKVFIFGAGSCRSLANFASYYLKMLLDDVHLVYTSSQIEILEEMFSIGEQDCLLALSFPRYSSRAVRTVHFAQSRRAHIVAITDSKQSPIAGYADDLLLAHSDMPYIVDSLVAPLAILNALIVAVSVKTLNTNRNKLAELEELWDTYRVYDSGTTPPRDVSL